MTSNYSKKRYWFIPLITLLLVFIGGCVQQPSKPLTRPSDNSITEPVNESKLKRDYYYPDCYPTSPVEEKIRTGKRWARDFNMRLICESACPREYHVFLPWPVQETFDGGFITVGYISNLTHTSSGAPSIRRLIGGPVYEGPRHVYLLKADADGNLLNRTYGEGTGMAVQQTSDGGYAIAVYGGDAMFGFSEGGSSLIKTDTAGSMMWIKSFEICGPGQDDKPYSIFQTSDGGYIVAGITTCNLGSSNRTLNGFLLKVDANGNKIWGKTFGVGRINWLWSAYQTSDGGYIAFGSTRPFGKGHITSLAPAEFYLVKTDADGNMILNRTFGEYDYDIGYLVKQTSDGGFVVSRAEYVFKLDENGNRLWNKSFEFTHNGCPETYGYIHSPFWQTSDGGFVVVAQNGVEEQKMSFINLVKFDENGNLTWYKQVFTWGTNITTGQMNWVQQTSDGGYIISASGDPGGGAAGRNEHGDAYWLNTPVYYYLAKTDENGNI